MTLFYEHFKELLDHANFQLNKEFKRYKSYVYVNHKGKKVREIWKEFFKTRQSEYPDLVKIDELTKCF